MRKPFLLPHPHDLTLALEQRPGRWPAHSSGTAGGRRGRRIFVCKGEDQRPCPVHNSHRFHAPLFGYTATQGPRRDATFRRDQRSHPDRTEEKPPVGFPDTDRTNPACVGDLDQEERQASLGFSVHFLQDTAWAPIHRWALPRPGQRMGNGDRHGSNRLFNSFTAADQAGLDVASWRSSISDDHNSATSSRSQVARKHHPISRPGCDGSPGHRPCPRHLFNARKERQSGPVFAWRERHSADRHCSLQVTQGAITL